LKSPTKTSESTAPSDSEVHEYWNGLLKPYKGAIDRKAWFQLLTTAGLLAVNWFLMFKSLEVSYWLTLALAIPAIGFQLRLFIFLHDCSHGCFFESRRLNNIVGFLIGVVTLTPFAYWRRTHAIHHGTSGDLDRRGFGDVRTLTVAEYKARPRKARIGYWIYRHPLVLLGFGPFYQFVLKQRLPLDIPRSWKKEWSSVLWTNLFIAATLLLAWQLVGLGKFALVQLPIVLLSGSAGIWLFYIQHQFEDTYWREHEEWDFHRAGIEGSSLYDLPSFLHWFTGNIGFHHVHHLASMIPNYRLQNCYEQVSELHKVTKLSIVESLRCGRLHLWDEAEDHLISFRRFRQQYGSQTVATQSAPAADEPTLATRKRDLAGVSKSGQSR